METEDRIKHNIMGKFAQLTKSDLWWQFPVFFCLYPVHTSSTLRDTLILNRNNMHWEGSGFQKASGLLKNSSVTKLQLVKTYFMSIILPLVVQLNFTSKWHKLTISALYLDCEIINIFNMDFKIQTLLKYFLKLGLLRDL